MISVCTCSHSIEEHGIAGSGGACHVCECHCFHGAKRFPKSCRYRLREQREVDLPSAFGIPCGPGVTKPLTAADLGLFEEQEKAS